MEESSPVKLHQSRKRKKRSNPSPLVGILTRSKARIYSHRNRSGISRPDPVPRKPKSSLPVGESVEPLLDVSCNNTSRISSIKDLRMRRVFTPDVSSVIEEDEEEMEEETEDRKKLMKGSDSSRVFESNVVDAKSDELEKSEIEGAPNDMENGLNLKVQGICGNGSNSKSKMALKRCSRKKVFKASSSFSYKRLLPYLMDIVNDDSSVTKIEIVDVKSDMMSFAEKSCTSKVKSVVSQYDDSKRSENEDVQKIHTKPFNQQGLSVAKNELGDTAEICTPAEVEQKVHESDADGADASVDKERIQTTPPDAAIFNNAEGDHGGQLMEANGVLGEKQSFKGSEKNESDILRRNSSSKRDANSINRSDPNPCLQLRIFNPRSLSYRRLLPFLINSSKNNSCESRITELPIPQVDPKENTAEQNYANETKTENSNEKQLNEDLLQNLPPSVGPLPPDGSSPETNNNPISSTPQSSSTKYSSNDEPSLVISETPPPEPLMLIDLRTGKMPLPQSHSGHRTLEPCFYAKENCAPLPRSSTINKDILNKQSSCEEPGDVGKQKNVSDMGLELHSNDGEAIGKFSVYGSSFQVEASAAMVSTATGSLRGILKRNRRGCRGLCNCLNCTSFRLHADRAFEFSRNQMHDAEEVASYLMKELANLRFLLEKSIISDNDVAAGQLNPVLIQDACSKAQETESLAKERLTQLNYDLNVHCRIPAFLEPKVTFANCIQERAIPELDPLATTDNKG